MRALLLALVVAGIGAAAAFPAASQDRRAVGYLAMYKPGRFRQLQRQGRMVVLQFHSDSCELCVRQEESLERLARETGGIKAVFLQVDFDAEGDLRERYRVSAPMTLLLFRGESLLARETGLSTEDEIRTFVREEVQRSRGRPKPRPKRLFLPKR
ncbi:MAG: thioredoxin family protein [Elusimicrobiota bacterium]